jgi:hypothetical protein
MTFQQKLKAAKLVERKAASLICLRNDVSVVTVQDDTNWRTVHFDFDTSDGISYEVKDDIASMSTGNIFVEFRNSLRPTGISITTANFHIFHTGAYYLISTEKVKELMQGCRVRPTYPDPKTGTITFGYLVPRSVFISNAVLIPMDNNKMLVKL